MYAMVEFALRAHRLTVLQRDSSPPTVVIHEKGAGIAGAFSLHGG
jgi:hypothetical protein